jgi:hypothetical protein
MGEMLDMPRFFFVEAGDYSRCINVTLITTVDGKDENSDGEATLLTIHFQGGEKISIKGESAKQFFAFLKKHKIE